MDAQGRGRAGDNNVDPADQWVFDPDTGNYELRLDPGQAAARSSDRTAAGRRARKRDAEVGDTDTRPLPTQRGRRDESDADGDGERPAGGRAARRAAAARTATAAEAGPAGRRKRKPKKSGKKRALHWTAGVVGFVLVAGCGAAYYIYQELDGNISKVDVGVENDAVSEGPVNLLIIGTDSRSGKGNGGYGDAGSVGHADTTILMHISKDRTNATALSIPRDMITDIPNCPTKQKDGSKKTIPAESQVRFNTSLGQEGRDPGCTWRTVEKMTGLKINHFMMADFNAVKELSTAVDGVEVCAAKDLNDPKSHLKLKAGRHTVKGEQALAFVRTRHAIGFGSDLDRIKMQQQFLSSLIRKLKSSAFSSPGKLYDVSQAATKALTVDTGIGTAGKLLDFGNDLKKVDIDKITFATVPVLDNPKDPATVILNKTAADPLFAMVRADHTLAKGKKGKGKKSAPVKKAPPEAVRVDVTNGGGPIGSAQETVDWLQNTKAAKLSTNAGNAPAKLAATRLEYAPNQADQAATLADWMGLPKSALKKSGQNAGDRQPMKLVLGKDFKAPGSPIEAPTETPDGVQNVNADDKNVCAK
ncbi:LytR family transcriptional regulator [Streptomyces platensis]|uniref:LytR family transcriptional regulator n=1 Tax=Streptomyces platensis TaxID=58346 RepID=A0AAE6TMI7_STRPT|nr:LCP family protein [Streptomyces platensis]OSY37495.1 putative transcriptional regulator YwtF [Streptomyces platensis]QEV52864.1 LytR family transcriptional regulator [Streptomyces platensis]